MNEINKIDNWRYLCTKNLDFHYPPNLVIINEINDFVKRSQQIFDEICKYLKTNWDKENIDFYLYNDDKQTAEIWDEEVKLGFALPEKLMIHSRYNQSLGHELTHVISAYMTLNWSKLQILNEGLAEVFSGSRNYMRKFKKIFLGNKMPKLRILFNDDHFLSDATVNYAIGGVFVKYLLQNYKMDKFKEAWNETAHEDNEKNKLEFERVYHKSIEELEKEFISWLNI